jgi:pimeloyl-ACP methyl ester carboxylesterase
VELHAPGARLPAELEGQFKTVAYDARGWGKSDKTLAGYKLADLADEALSLVKALGIKQYGLCGSIAATPA